MSGFVPSEGPNLDGANQTTVQGATRQTVNAAPVAPGAGNTLPIFAAGEVINVRTTAPNEPIKVTLNVERTNANAAGNGTYAVTVDGVVHGVNRNGPTGVQDEGATLIDEVIDNIAAAGVHAIGAQVTSNGFVETVAAGARLLVQAAQFA